MKFYNLHHITVTVIWEQASERIKIQQERATESKWEEPEGKKEREREKRIERTKNELREARRRQNKM